MADRFDESITQRTIAIVLLIVLIVIAAWSVTWLGGYTLEQQSRSVSTAKDLLEIAALIIGALWTLRVYLVSRTERQIAAIEQQVLVFALPDARLLLRVFVTIRNISKVRIEIATWRLRADLILPFGPETAKIMAKTNAFSEFEAQWGSLTNGTFTGDSFQVALEPGEAELQVGNLIVPDWAEVVQVYSLFERSRDGSTIEGWSQRTVVDLRQEKTNERWPERYFF
jgi:hypothetical protein